MLLFMALTNNNNIHVQGTLYPAQKNIQRICSCNNNNEATLILDLA